jgi:hypothetical protein
MGTGFSEVHVDYQTLFNAAMFLAVGTGGWIVGRFTRALDRLDSDVRALPDKYVSKVDYRNDLSDIKNLLTRIEGKLDGKADK